MLEKVTFKYKHERERSNRALAWGRAFQAEGTGNVWCVQQTARRLCGHSSEHGGKQKEMCPSIMRNQVMVGLLSNGTA